MSFNIDKQTLEELNLLGKFRQGSVYSLFNKVKTTGGERLLNEMFNNPLNDSLSINLRTAVFKYFEKQQFVFPFDVQQIELMRDYVDSATEKGLAATWIDMLKMKLQAQLIRDERYKNIIRGLQATILTLNSCYDFLNSLNDAPGHYDARIKNLKAYLSDARMLGLMRTDVYQLLSVKTIVAYDHLLKSVMKTKLREIIDFIYDVDVNIAVSNVAVAKGFTYPTASLPKDNFISAKALAHPCLNNAVGNEINLDKNSNVLFLTGANMAGKSTLMKAVGISLYLAHMGFPVSAQSFDFSVQDGLYSSINVADNIGLGYSHFYAEVVRVKQAAIGAASGKKLLLMFDELFKGTNVKDAYDGTLAVTEAFAAYCDCLFIVSTHIIEVGEALKKNNNIQFAFLPTYMQGAVPKYTYRLQEGITEDRQGMMIIRNEGILELLENK